MTTPFQASKKKAIKEAEAEAEPAEKSVPKPAKSKSVSAGKRFIFVKYNNDDGGIVATHEIVGAEQQVSDHPWTTVPDGTAVAGFDLTGDLTDKTLIDIHKNYKVDVAKKKKPALARKS